jgi:hypothetical protein
VPRLVDGPAGRQALATALQVAAAIAAATAAALR